MHDASQFVDVASSTTADLEALPPPVSGNNRSHRFERRVHAAAGMHQLTLRCACRELLARLGVVEGERERALSNAR